MTEVISQIWFGILLAGIIGGITGWFLRGNGKKRMHELEKSWQKRYQQLMQEKTSCQEKVEQLHVIRHERNALSNKLKQMHDTTKRHSGLEARLSNLHQALEKKNQQHVEEKNNVGLLQKKITKMQALMHEKDSMVHVITQKLASSGVLNKEKQEYVEQLEQETSDLQQRLANSEKKMMANDAQIQQLTAGIEQEQSTAEGDRASETQITVEEFEQSQNEITELRTQLDNANVRILEDQDKIGRLVSELPVMAKQLHDSKEEIQRRDHEVDALQDILGAKLQEYEKMDRDLDEHRIYLLDANSKIEVLYDALDEEREKNQQINADNKLKDYRLSEYADDAENKALEIQALYGRLTSAEFDLMGGAKEGVGTVSANSLLSSQTDEVEHERQKLLKQCDLVESELSHYKSKLESADQQLEVQKVVNRKLREELGRILGKESESIEDELIADIAADASLDESEFIESTENEEEDDANIENIDKSIYDIPKTEFDAEEFVEIPVENEDSIETIEKEISDVEGESANGKQSHLTAALLSSSAVAAGVSQIDGDRDIADFQDNNGLSNDSDEAIVETSTPVLEVSEDMGREKLAILGWYGNDAPKINLLSYGSSYSNVDDTQGRLSLEKLDGMSGAKLSKLKAYGITSISDLHEFAKVTKGKRSALESKIKDDEWKAWCSHADLMRIDGMNVTECKMLNKLGVFSVEELSKVGVSELKGKIHQLKRKQKIAAAIGPNTVSNWVNASKELVQAST